MTNYDRLFQEQMKDAEFAKAYREARCERILNEFLESLKDQISKNEPKENILHSIDSIQKQLSSLY